LVPQFETPRHFQSEDLHEASRLLLVGFFKKIFVADNCATLANYAFDPSTPLNGPWALLGAVAFAFQIYGDFSGYTDIARGSARLFGFHLSRNFLFPYFAKGPSDFWRRWHITLSSWFRDYVYIPLGGNRASGWRVNANLFTTMLAAGLWHGANWTFLAWGAFHGMVLVLYRVIPPLGRLEKSQSGWASFCAVSLMLGVTCVGWVLFRAPDFATCLAWFRALSVWSSSGVPWVTPFFWLLLHCAPLLLLQFATRQREGESDFPPNWHWSLRGFVYALLFVTIASSAISEKEFLYFQF
jgi:D-alanyl-lipoteichoic acid acyltransferase DltB (MBOAT superfamily)